MLTPNALKQLPISIAILAKLSNRNSVTLQRKVNESGRYRLSEQDLKALLIALVEIKGLIGLCEIAIKKDMLEILKAEYGMNYNVKSDWIDREDKVKNTNDYGKLDDDNNVFIL